MNAVLPQILLLDCLNDLVQRVPERLCVLGQRPLEAKRVGGPQRGKLHRDFQVVQQRADLLVFFKLALLRPMAALYILIILRVRVNRQPD